MGMIADWKKWTERNHNLKDDHEEILFQTDFVLELAKQCGYCPGHDLDKLISSRTEIRVSAPNSLVQNPPFITPPSCLLWMTQRNASWQANRAWPYMGVAAILPVFYHNAHEINV